MNLSQLPSWSWLVVLAVGAAFYLWRVRPAVPADRAPGWLGTWGRARRESRRDPPPVDPHLALQHEIIRGILRKEGLLPPAVPAAPTGTRRADEIEITQRFKIVPLEEEPGGEA
ncbi:MAG TPA: hypothetical protein PKD86_15085 [Gemmatales bacterium]|nr:hypothetical protein [Gemmatales bacterium]